MTPEEKQRNMQLALDGKPHIAMSIHEVIDALEKGESYVGEPGYDEQIAKWARLGAHIGQCDSCAEDGVHYCHTLRTTYGGCPCVMCVSK